MSELEKKLDKLLAEEWGVTPEEITDDLVRQKTHEFYESPNLKIDMDFVPIGMRHLKIMTPYEIKKMGERADAFLDQFR